MGENVKIDILCQVWVEKNGVNSMKKNGVNSMKKNGKMGSMGKWGRLYFSII